MILEVELGMRSATIKSTGLGSLGTILISRGRNMALKRNGTMIGNTNDDNLYCRY